MTSCFIIKFVIKIYDEKIDTRRKAIEKELRKKKGDLTNIRKINYNFIKNKIKIELYFIKTQKCF